ncbi:hypothetical protein SacmaDRAFT_4271 [Saccharomonospora marina XMU15]|uniref:Carboxymuconolactone decarboxylase-like domain-containing protein n=1 Tax=Saccharomonospora marina XMU15 TaxID=882083 RepID=H5X7V9_9PSEU|nr:carboxymuconolactone decarboxylase family protein [Saccharomonospora marina]EHR52459.1 hypothetical protein SacmaDRAFT_4271 [Saccharomonospora marina XMU15]
MAPRVPKAQLTGLTGRVIKLMSRKMLGKVAEPVEVAWHNRKVLRTAMSLETKLKKWDAVEESLKSFAHMAVAAQVGCGWCLDFGYFKAQNENLDLAKASQVPRWRESDVFTPLERDVLEYAEAMTNTPPTVTDGLSARLLERLGPGGMVELTGYIAFANLVTRNNAALGIESQGFSDSCEIPLTEVAQRRASSGTASAS